MNKTLKLILTAMLFLLFQLGSWNQCHAKIYKYRDKDGTWAFTDDPSVIPDLEAAGVKEVDGVHDTRDWDAIRKWTKELAQKAQT